MILNNSREISNFRDGCIQDLKQTLINNYSIKIGDEDLEDFINEIGDLCYWISSCNWALHCKKEELQIEEQEEFLKLYE